MLILTKWILGLINLVTLVFKERQTDFFHHEPVSLSGFFLFLYHWTAEISRAILLLLILLSVRFVLVVAFLRRSQAWGVKVLLLFLS